jgi:hypothetical protein
MARGTLEALNLWGRNIRWVRLPRGDNGAYGRLFRSLWEAKGTFVICEHDVVPTFDQLAAITTCGHGWCSFQYDDELYPPGPMFGLVRFDRSVMLEHPHAAEVALIIGKRRDLEAEWWRVDSLVARDLQIRRVEWVEHGPPVHHCHSGPVSGPP